MILFSKKFQLSPSDVCSLNPYPRDKESENHWQRGFKLQKGFQKEREKERRGGGRRRQTSDSLFEIVECKLRIIFLSISKRECPSSKINFHRTSRFPPPLFKPHYRSQFHPQIFRQMSARTSLLSHFPSTVALFHQLESNYFSSTPPPPRSNILRGKKSDWNYVERARFFWN